MFLNQNKEKSKAHRIRIEKLKVLRAVKPLKLCDLVTGQYEASGEQRGYLEDATVTDTLAAGRNARLSPTLAEFPSTTPTLVTEEMMDCTSSSVTVTS